MALFNPPSDLHGFHLSERSRWLLYAPTWMMFPEWRKRVFAKGMADYMVKWDWMSHGRDATALQKTYCWPPQRIEP